VSAPVGFVVVDNQRSVHDACAELARRHSDRVSMVGSAVDVSDLDLTVPAPDVVVLDLYLGRDDTPSTPWIPDLVAWGAAVLLHTSSEFPVPLREAVRAGAAGLSLKNDDPQQHLEAVVAVAAGEFACSSPLARALLTDPDLVARLSPREVDVVQAIDDGLTHDQVAARHGIAPDTVNKHLRSARARYVALGRDMTNAHSVVREARRDGWLGR
jgi:DNA-binding NarL/FixJ family response regulator